MIPNDTANLPRTHEAPLGRNGREVPDVERGILALICASSS